MLLNFPVLYDGISAEGERNKNLKSESETQRVTRRAKYQAIGKQHLALVKVANCGVNVNDQYILFFFFEMHEHFRMALAIQILKSRIRAQILEEKNFKLHVSMKGMHRKNRQRTQQDRLLQDRLLATHSRPT